MNLHIVITQPVCGVETTVVILNSVQNMWFAFNFHLKDFYPVQPWCFVLKKTFTVLLDYFCNKNGKNKSLKLLRNIKTVNGFPNNNHSTSSQL